MAGIYRPNTGRFIPGHSTSPLDPSRCKAGVFSSERWASYSQCQRKAVKDGWCRQHHPDAEAERERAAAAKYNAQSRKRALGWNGEELLRALGKIRDGDNDPRETARRAIEDCGYEPKEPNHD